VKYSQGSENLSLCFMKPMPKVNRQVGVWETSDLRKFVSRNKATCQIPKPVVDALALPRFAPGSVFDVYLGQCVLLGQRWGCDERRAARRVQIVAVVA